jgi:hypothetical protein
MAGARSYGKRSPKVAATLWVPESDRSRSQEWRLPPGQVAVHHGYPQIAMPQVRIQSALPVQLLCSIKPLTHSVASHRLDRPWRLVTPDTPPPPRELW